MEYCISQSIALKLKVEGTVRASGPSAAAKPGISQEVTVSVPMAPVLSRKEMIVFLQLKQSVHLRAL